jgi:hypothetical protein
MGSAAVTFVLLVVVAILAIGWSASIIEAKSAREHISTKVKYWQDLAERGNTRTTQLEAEIQRLRKIPLTPPPEKADNSTIKAKSSADVRRLTEAAFGLQPEIGEQNDIE